MTDTGGEVALTNHNLLAPSHFTSTYQLQPVPGLLTDSSPTCGAQQQQQQQHIYRGASAAAAVDGQQQPQQITMANSHQSQLPEVTQIPPQPGAELQPETQEEEPTIDIAINNVVSSFTTRCHLDLKTIAQQGSNVMYRRENGMVSMKLRRPYTTASIWSSGKITCTGARSEEEAKIAARRFARVIQNLGYKVRFANFRIVNVLGTCSLPFGIRITHFSRDHKENASYEPEIHPGVTYKIKPPNKATLKIFSTGSITVTAPSVLNVQLAIEHIFPLVHEYRMDDCELKKVKEREKSTGIGPGTMHLMPKSRKAPGARYRSAQLRADDSDDDSFASSSDEEDSDFDSEESQD